MIRTHQIGDRAIGDSDGCAPIARHAVCPRQAANGIGEAAAVFIKGGVEGAVAVEGEQTCERIRSTAGSIAAKSESRHVNHHAAIQQSIGETSRRSLLPQHDAIQQGGGSRDRVTLHRKQLSRVHDVKYEIQIEWRSPDRESKVDCAAPRGGIGHGVICRRKCHRRSRAISVDVRGFVGQSARTVRSKPPGNGRAIVRVVEPIRTKRVVTRNGCGAIPGSV